MRIAALAAQVERETRQTRLVKNLAEGKENLWPRRSIRARKSTCREASLRQPTLARKYHAVRRLPIELH